MTWRQRRRERTKPPELVLLVSRHPYSGITSFGPMDNATPVFASTVCMAGSRSGMGIPSIRHYAMRIRLPKGEIQLRINKVTRGVSMGQWLDHESPLSKLLLGDSNQQTQSVQAIVAAWRQGPAREQVQPQDFSFTRTERPVKYPQPPSERRVNAEANNRGFLSWILPLLQLSLSGSLGLVVTKVTIAVAGHWPLAFLARLIVRVTAHSRRSQESSAAVLWDHIPFPVAEPNITTPPSPLIFLAQSVTVQFGHRDAMYRLRLVTDNPRHKNGLTVTIPGHWSSAMITVNWYLFKTISKSSPGYATIDSHRDRCISHLVFPSHTKIPQSRHTLSLSPIQYIILYVLRMIKPRLGPTNDSQWTHSTPSIIPARNQYYTDTRMPLPGPRLLSPF
ncbi:hypothetical protein LIA77_00287 [Sarocladium implicatum]|nr:hypothetical protein LIA77_00287 [Sarocladium implicatum]